MLGAGDRRWGWCRPLLRLHDADLELNLPTGICWAPSQSHYIELRGYNEEDTDESGTCLAISLKILVHEYIVRI